MAKKVLKILCVFFLLSAFLFGGCDNSESTKAVVSAFSADFSADYKSMNIKGTLYHTRQGITSINITYPKTLSGLNVGSKNGGVFVVRENLQCTADEAYLPSDSFPCIVNSVFEGISQDRTKLFEKGEKEDIYSLQTNAGSCSVVFDKNGTICKAQIKDADFKMIFTNVKSK